MREKKSGLETSQQFDDLVVAVGRAGLIRNVERPVAQPSKCATANNTCGKG